MEKMIVDGKVAVLYSPGFGAVREVVEILGFEVIGQKQGYNAYVKTRLIQAAGLGYE